MKIFNFFNSLFYGDTWFIWWGIVLLIVSITIAIQLPAIIKSVKAIAIQLPAIIKSVKAIKARKKK